MPDEVAHIVEGQENLPSEAAAAAILGVVEDLKNEGFGSQYGSEKRARNLDDRAMATQVLTEIDGLVHDTLQLMYGTLHHSLPAAKRSDMARALMNRYRDKLKTATLAENFIGTNDIDKLHTDEEAANLVAEKILNALQAEYPNEYPNRQSPTTSR